MSARLSGWRVALRVARREALRRRGQTALMLVLVCLPVVAITAAAVVWRTSDVSSTEAIPRRIGSAAALVTDSFTDRAVQSPDPEQLNGTLGETRPADYADVAAVLGDRPVVPYSEAVVSFEVEGGRATAFTQLTDLRSPITKGLVDLRSGRFPEKRDEVLVNPVVEARGARVGSMLTVLDRSGGEPRRIALRVVGVGESAATRTGERLVVLPGAFGPPQRLPDGSTPVAQQWLMGGGPVSWSQVRQLNNVGYLATSRAVLEDPPDNSTLPPEAQVPEQALDEVQVTLLVLVFTMVLIEVVLLAGPAFAVRAKAQARSLALLAAAGGTPAQARRTVLASGVVIGLVGAVVGIVLGVGIGGLATPIAQRFSDSWFGPFQVPWDLVAVTAVFGVVAALAAAVLPAVSASRQNVVAVLGGRRSEGRISARSPLLGGLLLAAGVACGIVGSRGGAISPPLVAASALLAVLGMLGLVGVVVAGVARTAAHLPLTLRFAARDAARHRARTVPAVAAVAATVAGVVTLGIALSTQVSAEDRDYVPTLQAGWGVAMAGDADPAAVARAAIGVVGKDRAEVVPGADSGEKDGYLVSLDAVADNDSLAGHVQSSLGVPWVASDTLPDYLDIPAGERRAAQAALDAGRPVALVPAEAGPTREVRGTLTAELGREYVDASRTKVVSTPMRVVVVPGRYALAQGVLPTSLLPRLDLVAAPASVVTRPGVTSEQEKKVQEAVQGVNDQASYYVERGYQADDAVVIIRAVLVILGGILMLGGTLTATFLALSDARPDLATMAAVGARPQQRRRIAAGYALVVGGVGSLLGGVVGFVPGIAVGRAIGYDFGGDSVLVVPWLQIVLIVAALPLLTAAAVGLAARGRLPLVARTA